MISEPIRVALQIAEILEQLSIQYLIGGSIASSIYGEPRATQDIDLVAALQDHHIKPFVEITKTAFYIEEADVRQAITQCRSFNVVHLETMIKVDIFVLGSNALDHEEMRRRQQQKISGSQLIVATPEDVILQKLIWFQKGGRVSDRQWRDVLGVLKVQAERLDWDYLSRWAKVLDFPDLLQQAKEESNLNEGNNG